MSINISEVIWTIICFFALLFVLKTFLFGPLIRFMDERRSRIEGGLAEKRRADDALAENERQIEENWTQRRAHASQMLSESKDRDEETHAQAMQQVHAEAAQAIEAARERVAQEEAAAQEAAVRQGEALTQLLAARLLADAGGQASEGER